MIPAGRTHLFLGEELTVVFAAWVADVQERLNELGIVGLERDAQFEDLIRVRSAIRREASWGDGARVVHVEHIGSGGGKR